MLTTGIFLMQICLLISGHRAISVDQSDIKKLRKTGRINGDFIIGALFPIHGLENSMNRTKPLECDIMRSNEGIQLVEAAFYAVDSINRNDAILPNITLGITIKDECWSEVVALYQTIKLTRTPSLIGRSLDYPGDQCAQKNATPLIGMIGPGSGASVIPVLNFLELFQIPLIGYSVSRMNLKRSRYYFSVIPSVYQEAYMIVQLLKKFKLSYVSVAYTDDYFGISGKFYLQEWADYPSDPRICIATNIHLPKPDRPKLHSQAIRKLFEDKRVKVIVCFCDEHHIISLFAAIRARNLTGKFMIIGVHDRLKYDLTVNGYEEEAHGSIMVDIRRSYLAEFDEYYLAKTLQNNRRNPWFEEFWEYRFQCKIHSDAASSSKCTGNEKLSTGYKQGSKISYVIRSVHALANALHKMYQANCKKYPCSSLYPFNATQYMRYLKYLNFSFDKEHVDFSMNGSPNVARYDVFNYQKINDTFKYVKISEYSCDSSNYKLYHSNWTHFEKFASYQLPGGKSSFKSSCSDPCIFGHIKQNQGRNEYAGSGHGENGESACCWSCVPCKPEEIVSDSTTCKPCAQGQWPDHNKTKCLKLPIEYAQWTSSQCYLATGLSIFGIILTLLTTAVFFKHRDTPVVKSSTRELCYIILLGVLMHHCTIFLCAAEPSIITCFLLRICPPMSYTLVFGALLVKTNRIARLLVISKRRFPNLNPRFMTLKAQGILVGILIMVQVILSSINVTVWQTTLIWEFNKDMQTPKTLKRCDFTAEASAICAIYNLILMFLCSYYAFKARNIPDNFNEAKFIGFLTYITTLTCTACTLIYYGSERKMLSVGISMSVNGFNVLILLFFPKLYIILWVPERNTRQYFTTATGIRCIIGRKDIISNEQLLRKKFMRKDLENIEDLYSLRTSSTKETSEDTTRQEF
ncbi:metabotropic glutamate receptor 1-like [Planococcus citri]|uniref:metabotropic glutamate receptor 1-like n=1 Tax=Planococcus citri TaxID=170843 RepID=UPI0031F8E914